MGQSLVKILVHIVFSTKYRHPLIPEALEPELYRYISRIVRDEGCTLIEGNGTEDHTHLLVAVNKRLDLPALIGRIKRSTTIWMKREKGVRNFRWQAGYGAFSIGESQKRAVVNYIRNQKERHRSQSFQEEFLELLTRYEVEYDERYIWD